MAQSKLGHLLHEYVDTYLMPDLATMADVQVPQSGVGGIGFPLVQTVMAGIELLGRLELGKGKDKGFRYYWREHLVSVAAAYGTPGLDDLFYQLFRHGIAHTTFAKGGDVVIVKHQPDLHLRAWDGKLYVDCARLSDDFRQSYEESFRRRLGDASVRQTAEANADRFINEFVRDAARYGAPTILKMPHMPGPPTWPTSPAAPAGPYMSIGATGPASPPGSGSSSVGPTGPAGPINRPGR